MMRTLQPDDVVFMYAADDPAVYADYGATVVAWGGAHTLERVRQYKRLGIHATGTMWCLTAGPEALHRDPDLREATCRDIEGNPIPVPWQVDHVYEGTPTWFGCTNHPAFRAHVRAQVCHVMAGGAQGLHVDDHLGSAHPASWQGGCFCDYCMREFREYLLARSNPALLAEAGVASFDGFDYRDLVRRYAATRVEYLAIQQQIPLHQVYVDFQLQRAAENTRQLGALAAEITGRPVTLSANTCLPHLEHVVVAPDLTYLVGEVAQYAAQGAERLIEAVRAYRMAETIGKPIAATAAGWDWAYVKEHGCESLVRLWIALAYACGQRLMAPHRMWCFTREKGTHWYDGPAEAYAPLYRFVRAHPGLFRDCVTVGPLAPPADAPARFDTAAQRDALQAALDRGNPHPLESGGLWVFPKRREDGAGVVHVVNRAYDPHTDTVTAHDSVTLTLNAEWFGREFRQVELFAYDAEARMLALRRNGNSWEVTIPQQRLWSVLLFS